jgi:thiol-disulfide isomerase/thioredoxin
MPEKPSITIYDLRFTIYELLISVVWAAALLFGCAALASAQEAASAGASKESQGGAAAAAKTFGLRLKGLDGKMYDLAEMRGEVVLVSFGATWCAPCAWELFALEELKEEYKGKPVRFLWVSIEDERQTSNALLRHFTKSYKVSFPVLRDPSKVVFAQFTNITRIPLVVFFDKEGRFVAPVHRGMSNETTLYKQHMRGRLDVLLNAPPAPVDSTGTTGATK